MFVIRRRLFKIISYYRQKVIKTRTILLLAYSYVSTYLCTHIDAHRHTHIPPRAQRSIFGSTSSFSINWINRVPELQRLWHMWSIWTILNTYPQPHESLMVYGTTWWREFCSPMGKTVIWEISFRTDLTILKESEFFWPKRYLFVTLSRQVGYPPPRSTLSAIDMRFAISYKSRRRHCYVCLIFTYFSSHPILLFLLSIVLSSLSSLVLSFLFLSLPLHSFSP